MRASIVKSSGKNICGLWLGMWRMPNMRKNVAYNLGDDVDGSNWFVLVCRPYGRFIEHIHMPYGACGWTDGETLHRYWMRQDAKA